MCRRIGQAIAGDSVGITLSEQIFVERAMFASHENETPNRGKSFSCGPFRDRARAAARRTFVQLRLANQDVKCEVVYSIERVMDSSTTGEQGRSDANNWSETKLADSQFKHVDDFVIDNHDRIPNLGRFVTLMTDKSCGGGTIFGGVLHRPHKLQKAKISFGRGKNYRQRASGAERHREQLFG
jgi:sulfate adenylyltransferase subunit 1 (EFTu-like GTPase family)